MIAFPSMDTMNTKNAHLAPRGGWAFLFARQRGNIFLAFWMLAFIAAAIGMDAVLLAAGSGPWPYDGLDGLHRPLRLHASVDVRNRRAIDGVPMPDGVARFPVYAVMIENSPDARPLSGLAAASLVFEAPVEGGITRFMAVYAAGVDVPKIGPVRSSRKYFVDWAQEFGGVYAHVGGSPEALDFLRQADVRDLNEITNGRFFWRDNVRRAPHNAYTSTDLLRSFAAGAKKADSADFEAWHFKDSAPSEKHRTKTADLVIDFSTPTFRVAWTYDPDRDEYLRRQGGQMQRDADGTVVRAKNVVVFFTKVEVIDGELRLHVITVGDGRALVSSGGHAVSATWQRDASNGRTRFYGNDGKEIELSAGPTWVEVASEGTPVRY